MCVEHSLCWALGSRTSCRPARSHGHWGMGPSPAWPLFYSHTPDTFCLLLLLYFSQVGQH